MSNLHQWIVGHQINPLFPNQPGHPNWSGRILGQALMCTMVLLWQKEEVSPSSL
jgi:hypothetical protein